MSSLFISSVSARPGSKGLVDDFALYHVFTIGAIGRTGWTSASGPWLLVHRGADLLNATLQFVDGSLDLIGVLAFFGLASAITFLVMLFLLYRCADGLRQGRKPMKAMQLGIRETIYGAVLVISVIVGHYTGV